MTNTPSTQRSLTPLLFMCFFLSGITGLGYEVVWARYFALFIGGSAYAHTIVLATFMGGLALGNALFGRLADRVKDRLLLYAVLELGIGASCFFFPEFFAILGDLYLTLARGAGFGASSNLILKFLLCAVSILIPTVLMGGTLPVLARFVVRSMGEVGRRIGQLYFINTGGAVIGSLLCGFLLIPSLGMNASTRGFALFNMAIGVVFLVLRRVVRETETEAVTESESESHVAARIFSRRQARWVLVCVGVSGFVSMTYELVWIRLLSLVLGSSVHSFTIMLVTFIGGIALGGIIAGRLMDQRGDDPPVDPLKTFAWAEIGVFGTILAMVPMYERLPFYFNVFATLFERSEAFFPFCCAWRSCCYRPCSSV